MIAIDELVRTRRRTLAIIVEDDGRIVVRAPLRLKAAAIDEFVNAREKWIITKREQARARAARFVPKEYVSGEEFLYLGEPYRLDIEDNQSRPLILNGSFHLSRAAVPRAEAVFQRWYRRQALRVDDPNVPAITRPETGSPSARSRSPRHASSGGRADPRVTCASCGDW